MTQVSKLLMIGLLLGGLTSWGQIPIPLPKPKDIVDAAKAAATDAATAAVAEATATATATKPEDERFSHADIIAELQFEAQLAAARGEDITALNRVIAKHQSALAGDPPKAPILGGAWVDPGTGASFSIYQEADRVVVITETLGQLDELWQRLDGIHSGKAVSFVLDGELVEVKIQDGGNRLSWGENDHWKRIPQLTGTWADPATDFIFSVVQTGTDVMVTMVSEEGKKFWTQVSGTQRGDRLVLEYKDGFASTIIEPEGQVILWADAAKTRWVKLPPLAE